VRLMVNFMKAMLSMRSPWPIWIALLMAVNMVAPVFFLESLEARIVLAAALFGAAIQMAIFRALGFVRLLGMGHVLWIAMVPWLWVRLQATALDDAFAYWLLSVVVVDGLSLVIDAADVLRFLRGERAPVVAGDPRPEITT